MNDQITINVKEIDSGYDFCIKGVSYAGAPQDNTAMYITSKASHLLEYVEKAKECLIFVSEDMHISQNIMRSNSVIKCKNPTLEYARFIERLYQAREDAEAKCRMKWQEPGYYISDSAIIGENAYIEAGCVIGHHVRIGKNAKIYSGAVIKNAVIGDDFVCNEGAVIGSQSFTMAEDERGNPYRVHSMGNVIIGNCVEVGVNNNIARGSTGDTVLEDYVKLDALIYIGHDTVLHEDVEITAGVMVPGFVEIGKRTYVGVGACIRNRIHVGDSAVIGMGAVVTKHVESKMTVVGNPAKPLEKRGDDSNGI